MHNFPLPTMLGVHVDFPSHPVKGGLTLSRFPLSRRPPLRDTYAKEPIITRSTVKIKKKVPRLSLRYRKFSTVIRWYARQECDTRLLYGIKRFDLIHRRVKLYCYLRETDLYIIYTYIRILRILWTQTNLITWRSFARGNNNVRKHPVIK